MSDDKKKSREAELDDFWDIDALIPPKKNLPHYPANTEAAEIVIEPPVVNRVTEGRTEALPPRNGQPTRRFIPPHTAEEEGNRPQPELEYTPDNALIRRVRLYPWRSQYRYYESFARDAEKLNGVRGAVCQPVPFFSYVPQYSQMNRSQLEWYLWWRTCLRSGEYPTADYSYILLYAYELINLSDRLDPTEVRDLLCRLWVAYRNTFRQLDSYLPEWICDCCLLHRLPPPSFENTELLSAAMSHCTLKEFYLPADERDGYLRALLAFCSNYDYRKSKFCTAENKALFDSTVMGALTLVTRQTAKDGKLFAAAKMDDSLLRRDAYTGALCSYRIKRKIEVEYCSFSRSHELRYLITDVVKYTENKLRAALGIRSRLSVYALPIAIREALDAYLAELLPKRGALHREAVESPAYEKLYDLPRHELSLRNAAEIERSSWDTTERLIEAFEDEPSQAEQELSLPLGDEAADFLSVSVAPPSEEAIPKGDFTAYRAFLSAVSVGDVVAQRAVAAQMQLPIELLVDEINEKAADLLGDILLEESDRGYAVIEDYGQLLEQLIRED